MKAVHRCLKDNGIFLLHTIGYNETGFSGDPWISKYIFPNGKLPSIAQIGKAIEGLFVMEDWHNLGEHYEKTLLAWHKNFNQAWLGLKNRYDEKFRRMFEYYLLSSAGSFRARHLQLWQIVFTKYGTQQPACR
jgi:cyclopropane-fatty-acyl-phospholipid synthase